MKILVIAQTFPPFVGGPSTRAQNAVKGLQSLGHKIIVLTAFPRGSSGVIPKRNKFKPFFCESKGKNVKIFKVWIPPLSYTGFGKRLLMYLSFICSSVFPCLSIGKVDVIWAANPNFFSMFPAVFYGLIHRVPIVRNVDDLWPEAVYDFGFVKSMTMKRVIDFVSKISYLLPDAITPISPSYKRVISNKYGVRKDKIHTIEVGVNTDVFHPLWNEDHPEKFVVMYSGKLGLAYDFDTVLESAKSLSKFKDIVSIIRGKGKLAPHIKDKIEEFGLKNVLLDTKYVERSELCKVLNYADVFLIPHRVLEAAESGLPTKLFEYQACGKPIICSSRGEPARYIRSTGSGIVVPPEDPEALSKAVLELYKDKEKRQRLGSNGWMYASRHYSCEKIGQRIYSVFRELVCTNLVKNKFNNAS